MNAPDSSGPDERFDESLPDDLLPLLEMFDTTAPPDPGPAAWAGVFDRMAAEFPPDVRRPWWPAAAASVGLVAAGLLATLTGGPNRVTAPAVAEVVRQPVTDDPLAGFAVLPIAGDDEVDVRAVRGTVPVALVIGDSPEPTALPLAEQNEVWVRSGAAVPCGPTDRPVVVLTAK